jgi:hypothetical protein
VYSSVKNKYKIINKFFVTLFNVSLDKDSLGVSFFWLESHTVKKSLLYYWVLL